MSDHCLIVFNLSAGCSKPAPTQYTHRNIKGVDLTDFDSRLRSSALFTDPADSPDEYLTQFETTVTTILDQVAPLKIGRRAGDPDAIATKRCRRRLERHWKKTGSDSDRIAY